MGPLAIREVPISQFLTVCRRAQGRPAIEFGVKPTRSQSGDFMGSNQKLSSLAMDILDQGIRSRNGNLNTLRPRIIRPKENASELDYSSFYAKTGAGDPLLCGRSPAFLMNG